MTRQTAIHVLCLVTVLMALSLLGFGKSAAVQAEAPQHDPQQDATQAATNSADVPDLNLPSALDDFSLVSQTPCGPPCFHGVTVGKTAFATAVKTVRVDGMFDNFHNQDSPPQATWTTNDGVACCEMTADPQTGIVNAILIHVTPLMNVGSVINNYGDPAFVGLDTYSGSVNTFALVFPKAGIVAWAATDTIIGQLSKASPIVMVLYLDPKTINKQLQNSTLQAWAGYQSYSVYQAATPVITPISPTATPGS